MGVPRRLSAGEDGRALGRDAHLRGVELRLPDPGAPARSAHVPPAARADRRHVVLDRALDRAPGDGRDDGRGRDELRLRHGRPRRRRAAAADARAAGAARGPRRRGLHALMGLVVVSGGGSGLGRAAALRLAADGHEVIVVGRRLDALEQTCAAGTGGRDRPGARRSQHRRRSGSRGRARGRRRASPRRGRRGRRRPRPLRQPRRLARRDRTHLAGSRSTST